MSARPPRVIVLTEDGSLYAVGNIDPFGRAAVMSRGLVGCVKSLMLNSPPPRLPGPSTNLMKSPTNTAA